MLGWPVAACLGGCCSPGCRLWCVWWCLFVLSFFPRGVLDEILNLIESVSEDFPSYSHRNSHTEIPEKKKSTS